MTMANVPGISDAREQLRGVGNGVRQRSRDLVAELQQLEREEHDVNVGARALLQAIDDDRRSHVEEADQLARVLGRQTDTDQPAPAPAEGEQAQGQQPPADHAEQQPAQADDNQQTTDNGNNGAAPGHTVIVERVRSNPALALLVAVVVGVVAFFLARWFGFTIADSVVTSETGLSNGWAVLKNAVIVILSVVIGFVAGRETYQALNPERPATT